MMNPETKSVISSHKRHTETSSDDSSKKTGAQIRSVITCIIKGSETITDVLKSTMEPETNNAISDNCMLVTHARKAQKYPKNTSVKSSQQNPQLDNHVASHLDKKSLPLKCDFCSRSFKYPCKLKEHIIKHTELIPLECKFCSKTYREKTEFNNHIMKFHSGLKKYVCIICLKRFSTKELLRKHVQTHSVAKPFECGVCHKRFLCKSKLLRHQSQVHSHTDKVECEVCKKSLSSEYFLREHRKRHTSNEDYTCDLCGKAFKTLLLVKNHIAKHLALKRTCKICGKLMLSSNLSRHMAIHNVNGQEASRDLSCDLCGKVLANKKSLAIHMKTHTETKQDNITCKICGKSVQHIARHMKRHGEKCCKCEICGKVFMTYAELKRHINIHTGEMHYSCPICSNSFNSKSIMIRHKRFVHERVKSFECSVCDREYKDKARHLNFKVHKRSIQNKPGK